MEMPSSNAWLICLADKTHESRFSVTIAGGYSLFRGIEEGDGALIAYGEPLVAVSFARIYRVRIKLEETTLFFDRVLPVSDGRTLTDLEVTAPEFEATMVRLEWRVFEAALMKACGIAFDALPVLEGNTAKEQAYMRELLKLAIIDDLLGPAEGPDEEIVGMSVRDRYLVGKLAPKSPGGGRIEEIPFAEEDTAEGETPSDLIPYVNEDHISRESVPDGSIEDDDEKEVGSSSNQSIVPSSIGFTFCVEKDLEEIQLIASWGRYERQENKHVDENTEKSLSSWKRKPSGGTLSISLKEASIGPTWIDRDCTDVIIKGSVSATMRNGDKLVTIFLVNNQSMPKKNQDGAWIFQPELIVRGAVFRRRPILRADEFDEEREALEMIYRNRVEFAVGHGVSVHATISENDPELATEIRTAVLPEYEIQVTETPGLEKEDRPAMKQMIDDGLLDMEKLASIAIPETRGKLLEILNILIEDYSDWITENRDRIGKSVVGYDDPAEKAMKSCKLILGRLKEGVEVLENDDRALAAFRFANLAMASQRIHSIFALAKRRGEQVTLEELNVAKNRSWRPFQLAFILLSIPALADPTHKDRTGSLEAFADLLWFPTGGGKTEAYLGVAAFAMAVRRLQGNMGGLDGSRGLCVIMRYTLRLLTLQQFQRATALICAMESIRKQEPMVWGSVPFTIGLWVGQKVTPNDTEESHRSITAARDGRRQLSSSPHQLTFCPWCGSEIRENRDIEVRRDVGKTIIYCSNNDCEFGRTRANGVGLPVVVVDDEIYRRPPSMLIATVDKFAMMAWRGQARTLFGKATRECPRHGLVWRDSDCKENHRRRGNLPAVGVMDIMPIRPPDLIIQDEFHLISGPLGTMVGLYETAVDELATWSIDGNKVHPKIVASTATVRKADAQVNNVFLRRVSVFPPHGLDVEDNFFSVQRPVKKKPGRLYMGICSPGSSRPAVLIRVYVALLTAAQSLFERFGEVADPYMTVVGYFNSLRELGGMRRLAEDDVQTRAYRVQMSHVKRPGLAQRSVRIVDELTSRVSSKDIPRKLDQLEVKFNPNWERGETRALDIVLATNMLSVGVDINRIGLMAVNGQPKNTAEYIQATSRIGRSFPGLVCTVLNWSRPRDLSHYETFEHYHASFYKHVEAQSVTPFAARALDRGLTGTMVSLLRLENESMNPNLGAQELDNLDNRTIDNARNTLSERAGKAKDMAAKTTVDDMTTERIDRWASEARIPGRELGYEKRLRQGDLVALLKKPGASAWDMFTVPMSMREVEPEVQLIIDDSIDRTERPQWRRANVDREDGGEA